MRSSPRVLKLTRFSQQARDIPVLERAEREALYPDACEVFDSPSPFEPSLTPTEELESICLPEEGVVEDAAAAAAASLREEAARLRAEAWEEGRRQGYADGKEEAAQLIRIAQRIADESLAAREEFIALTTPQLLKLAVQIAEKIIRREVETDPAVVQRMVSEALQRAVGRRHLQVRVNPDDLETLQAVAPELHAALDGVQEFEIVPDRRSGDRRMERGGCVVETEGGIIDARIEAQLEEVQTRLMGEED
jgi:flagellar assembly protein FliH